MNAGIGRNGQRGQGMTEYIIIVAMIAVAAIAVYQYFGQTVRNQTAAIAQELAGKDGTAAKNAAQASADQAKTVGNQKQPRPGEPDPPRSRRSRLPESPRPALRRRAHAARPLSARCTHQPAAVVPPRAGSRPRLRRRLARRPARTGRTGRRPAAGAGRSHRRAPARRGKHRDPARRRPGAGVLRPRSRPQRGGGRGPSRALTTGRPARCAAMSRCASSARYWSSVAVRTGAAIPSPACVKRSTQVNR